MIEVTDDSADNILAVRATGALTRADYRNVLAPHIRSLLDRFPTLRVMFVMDQGFSGWTLGGAWANTLLDLKHRHDFEKVALAGAPKWEEWCVKRAASALMKGELRTFRGDQLTDAWHWLRA